MTRGLTLPLIAAGGAAFKAASDLAESQNAARVAFGKQAPVIQRWSKNLDSAFGFTRKGALDAAAGFKLVAKDADLGAKDFTALAERAADLGSVFNVDTVQAADALKSALVGEFEPARKLGVVLNAAKIESKAFALGIAEQGEELSASQKQAAIYASVMEQTSFAQGDATKTANTSAGQIRTLKAEMGRAAEAIGKQLLPIGTQLLKFLRGLIARFQNLSPEVRKNVVRVAGLAAALGPVLFVTGKLIAVTGTAIKIIFSFGKGILVAIKIVKAFTLILAANPYLLLIAATIAIVVLIIKNWDKIKGFLKRVWDFIKSTAGTIWDGLRSATAAVVGFVMDKINAIRDAIQGAIDAVGNLINKIPGAGLIKGALGAIPGFAHGFHGVITKPTLFLAGEAGPERVDVTPQGQVGAGITINIQNAFGFDDFERKVTKALGRAMARTGAA